MHDHPIFVKRFARFLFLFTLLLAIPPSALRAEDEPTTTAGSIGLWSDQAHLDKHLALACDAVEKATARKFKRRPTVRISKTAEVEKILIEEIGGTLRRLGSSEAAAEAMLRPAAAGLVMKYEPGKDVVHVVPENVERIVKLLKRPALASADMLRITLAHEAAHGLDFQHHPHLDALRTGAKSLEALQAVGAIIEGHAQFVAERIAKDWGIEKAFGSLVELTVSAPPIDDPGMQVTADQILAEIRFAYVEGHAFFTAVHEARGDAGVEAALREPPATVRPIERPEIYLDPSKAETGIDLEKLLAPVEPLAEKLGRAVQPLRIKRGQFGAIFKMLPEARTFPIVSAYQDGFGVVAQDKATGDMFVAMAFELSSEKAAAGTVSLSLDLLKKKDELMKEGAVVIKDAKYEKGAGTGAKLPGHVCVKTIATAAGEQDITVHNTSVGRYALDITSIGDDIERAAQDAFVDEIVARLRAAIDRFDGAARPR